MSLAPPSAAPDVAWPRVSVIVPVYNGEATLPALLQALQAQRYPADLVEVIVADDASSDGSAAIVAAHGGGVRLVRAPSNCGSYAARNMALQVATGEVIAFTDADCRPEPDWLREGVLALRRQGGGLVAGAVCIAPIDRRSARQRYDEAFGIQQAFFALRQHFGATANLFAARPAFSRVPGFDASLRSGGDKRFCQDCVAAGLPFTYAPASRVLHAPRTRLRELAVKQVRVATGHARIFPLWSRYRIVPLSAVPAESFDRERFLREAGPLLKWRFRAVYYLLELVYLAAYARACLRRMALPASVRRQEAP